MDRNENDQDLLNVTGFSESKISRRKLLASLGIAGVAGVAAATGINLDIGSVSAAATGTIKIYNVKDYPGSDTAAIQAAIDECSTDGGGIVYFPPGTYLITSTIVIKSKVSLLGAGAASIIKADSALPDGSGLFLNENWFSGTVDTYYDNNIKISQLIMEGNSSTTRTTALISLGKCKNILIEDCSFQNNSHMGVALGGCFFVQIQNSRFMNCGRPKPSIWSAPALWAAQSGDGSPSRNIEVDNCLFANNNWAGSYFMPKGGKITNCTFVNNSEASVFINSSASDLQLLNNYMNGVTRSNISSSGIECGGTNVLIQGNHIMNCQSDGISLTDVKNVVVSSNVISNNGQDPSRFPTAGGISIIAWETTPNMQTNNVNINNNRIMDTQATKTQSYSIGVGGIGLAVTNVAICDNNLRDYKTAAMYIDGAKWGDGCYTENNLGHASAGSKVGEFLAPSSTGAFTITGIGFRPRRLEFRATLPGGQVYECESVFALNDGVCHWRSIKSGTAKASNVSNKAIALYDNLGGLLCEAALSSRDIDGFTLSFTKTTARPWVIWIAYP